MTKTLNAYRISRAYRVSREMRHSHLLIVLSPGSSSSLIGLYSVRFS